MENIKSKSKKDFINRLKMAEKEVNKWPDWKRKSIQKNISNYDSDDVMKTYCNIE